MPRRQRNLEKEALWRERLNDWKNSPDTIPEFCRLHELNEHTFRSWQKVISLRDAEVRTERQQTRGREKQRIEKTAFAPVTFRGTGNAEAFAKEIKVSEQRPGAVEIVIVTPRGYMLRLPMTVDANSLCMVLGAIKQVSC
jgi:hypothetical protein